MMQRRKAWKGQLQSPATQVEARRFLLDVARECVERFGPSKATLSDVAEVAGVTRQTVYRYFEDADDLFRAAAVLASGGFREHMRKRVMRRQGLVARIVETLVVTIRQVPGDPHLSALLQSGDQFTVSAALQLGFVQEELVALADGDLRLATRERDELAELLLRLLHSFLADPGEARSERELRAFLTRWLAPMIEAKLAASSPAELRRRA